MSELISSPHCHELLYNNALKKKCMYYLYIFMTIKYLSKKKKKVSFVEGHYTLFVVLCGSAYFPSF